MNLGDKASLIKQKVLQLPAANFRGQKGKNRFWKYLFNILFKRDHDFVISYLKHTHTNSYTSHEREGGIFTVGKATFHQCTSREAAVEMEGGIINLKSNISR